jgi:hypothetical protein
VQATTDWEHQDESRRLLKLLTENMYNGIILLMSGPETDLGTNANNKDNSELYPRITSSKRVQPFSLPYNSLFARQTTWPNTSTAPWRRVSAQTAQQIFSILRPSDTCGHTCGCPSKASLSVRYTSRVQLVDFLLGELDLVPVRVDIQRSRQQEVDLHVPGAEPDVFCGPAVQSVQTLIGGVLALHGSIVQIVFLGPLVDVSHQGFGLKVCPDATLTGRCRVIQDAVLAGSPSSLVVVLSLGCARRSLIWIGVWVLAHRIVLWVICWVRSTRSWIPALRSALLHAWAARLLGTEVRGLAEEWPSMRD